MSESRKNAGPVAETPVLSTREKRDKRRKEAEKQARRSRILYITAGVVCAVLAVFALAWGSGIIQRNVPAVTINGHRFSAADVQYYYSTYKNMYSAYGILTESDPRDQVVDETAGTTMYDTLVNSAISDLTSVSAAADEAEKEGFTLDEGHQRQLQENLDSIEEAWKNNGFRSRSAFIRAYYGTYMTYGKLKSIMEREILASAYQSHVSEGFEITDEDLQTYYDENKDSLDTYTLTYYSLLASVSTTDDEGNTIEMTDEEKEAALEEAKTAKKAIADDIKTRLDAGEDPQSLADEYEDELSSSAVSSKILGSSVNTSYSEWVMDSARKANDSELAESEGSDQYSYYVVRWEGRELVEDPARSVRHILVAAEQDEDAEEPTEEQYAAAEEEAKKLLDEWESGEKTAESFGALAVAHSADMGSAVNGGIIRDVTSSSGYVEEFTDWVLDEDRKEGDTGIVKNDGSSTKGYHVMYFYFDEPHWKITADTALRNEKTQEWASGIVEDATSSISSLGMKFLSI